MRRFWFQTGQTFIAPTDNVLQVRITFVESLGSATHAYCALPGVDETLTCTLDGQSRLRSGAPLALGIAPDHCYLFDASGRALRRLAAAPLAVEQALAVNA